MMRTKLVNIFSLSKIIRRCLVSSACTIAADERMNDMGIPVLGTMQPLIASEFKSPYPPTQSRRDSHPQPEVNSIPKPSTNFSRIPELCAVHSFIRFPHSWTAFPSAHTDTPAEIQNPLTKTKGFRSLSDLGSLVINFTLLLRGNCFKCHVQP